MTLLLADRATEVLGDLQPELSESPLVQNIVNALAREAELFETTRADVFSKLLPQNADDTYRTLGMWELLLGLPVEPPDIDIDTRRSTVLANVRKRRAGSGADWEDLLTLALGDGSWSYTENASAYSITILLPSGSSFSGGQVLALARRITPAHLEIVVGTIGGFIVGETLIGEAL